MKIQKSNLERKSRGLSIFNKTPGIRSKVRQFGRKALKQGTHPQMWRAGGPGGSLGPMGELGEDVIMEVTYKPGRLVPLKNLPASVQAEMRSALTGRFFNDVHAPLKDYVTGKIRTWVPVDTGALKNSMIGVVNKAETKARDLARGSMYRMTLGTPGVEYANPVNKMPTDWLKHPAPYHPNRSRIAELRAPGGKGTGVKKPLFDPNAKSGWYDLVLLNGRNTARKLWRDFFQGELVPIFRPFEKIRGSGVKKAENFVNTLFTVKFV